MLVSMLYQITNSHNTNDEFAHLTSTLFPFLGKHILATKHIYFFPNHAQRTKTICQKSFRDFLELFSLPKAHKMFIIKREKDRKFSASRRNYLANFLIIIIICV